MGRNARRGAEAYFGLDALVQRLAVTIGDEPMLRD